MITITAKLPDTFKSSLSNISKAENKSISDIFTDTIKAHILEFEEDIADTEEAVRRLNQNNKTTSWEEVQRECGLLED